MPVNFWAVKYTQSRFIFKRDLYDTAEVNDLKFTRVNKDSKSQKIFYLLFI